MIFGFSHTLTSSTDMQWSVNAVKKDITVAASVKHLNNVGQPLKMIDGRFANLLNAMQKLFRTLSVTLSDKLLFEVIMPSKKKSLIV